MDNEIETAGEEHEGLESFTTNEDSSKKTGRKYELQRKIDEELRKLQFEQQMEQEEEIGAGLLVELKGPCADAGNSASVERILIDDDKLDYSAVDRGGTETVSVPKETSQPPSATNEINTCSTIEDGEHGVKLNGIYPLGSTENETEPLNVDSQGTKLNRSETTNSDDLLDSSDMTSPTTTAGTYTLPPYSPGTEGDVNEVSFPVDQIPPTFRDYHLDGIGSSPSPQGMDISEASSNVFFGQDQALKTSSSLDNNALHEITTQNTEEVQSRAEISTQIVKESPSADVNCDLARVPVIQGDAMRVEVCEKDIYEENIETTATDSGLLDIPLPLNDRATDDDTIDDNLPASETGADEKKRMVEGSDLQSFSASPDDVTADDVVPPVPNTGGEEKHIEDEHNLQRTSTNSETLISSIGIESAEQRDQPNLAHEESFNRKISTDEDDYSGFDVDVCDPLSYQDEISIAESEEQSGRISLEPIRQACDADDVPYFVDGKYSVEQVTGENYDVPEPEYDESSPQIAPWDVVHKPVEDMSLSMGSCDPPIDASSINGKSSTSSRSTRSDPPSEQSEHIHQKIALEIVDMAIKSAYDVASGMAINENEVELTDEDVRSESSGSSENSTSESNHQEEGANFPTVDEIEQPAADQNDIGNTTVANEDTERVRAEYQQDQPDAGEARERDVTYTSASIEEKGLNSKITEVASASVDETAENNVAELSHVADAAGESLSVDDTKSEGRSSSGDSANDFAQDIGETNLVQIKVDSDTSSIPEKQAAENQDLQTHRPEQGDAVKEDDMVRVTDESPSKARHFPERITYNPALSQRNTEATKWFGQPTAEDKIWMKPSGKVDENAEIERRKLIKAMTRRHNPHLVPKWQPPKEKDLKEDLSAKQKASLERYEARRKSKPDFGEWNISTVQKIPEAAEVTPASSLANPESPSTPLPTRENIVIESVVHSRDAISVWESRLSEKQHKEQLEKKRLSAGKQKKRRERANTDTVRQRHDSNSSVSSNASGVLPTSEYIERESMNVSQVRNRWRNIEVESSKTKSPTNFKKETSNSIRSSSFSVNAGATYRSYQRPTPSPAKTKEKKEREIHGGPVVYSSKNESFIDREIREAAEREERWKQEQWEKMSGVSGASSEEVFPDNIPTPSKDPRVVATIYTRNLPADDVVGIDIMKDADREDTWKEEHLFEKKFSRKSGSKVSRNTSKDSSGVESALSAEIVSPTSRSPANHMTAKDADSESLSSYGSSITGNGIASPPPLSKMAHDQLDGPKTKSPGKESPATSPKQDATDSGIECNIVPVVQPKLDTAPTPFVTTSVTSTPVDNTDMATKKKEDQIRRQRIASLSSVVAPKGWESSKTRSNSSVSPVSPKHRSVPKPEVKSSKATPEPPTNLPAVSEQPVTATNATIVAFVPPQFEEPASTPRGASPDKHVTKEPAKDDAASSSEDDFGMSKGLIKVLEEKVEKKNEENQHESKKVVNSNHTPEVSENRTPPVVQKEKPSFKPVEKKGPHFTHKFEVSSGKSRLETIMEREMREAMEREEEWKQKQLELMKQGVDVSPHHIVHSTREIRTPTTVSAPPPENVGEPVLARREVKSLFAEDSIINAPYIHEDASDGYKKRTVVKANRVPRRKSTMAMQWEKGNFQNNVPDED